MRFSPLLLLLGIPLVQTLPQTSGIKVTVRDTLSRNFSTQQTTYYEGDRKRMETQTSLGSTLGPHIATIVRCDLGKTFMLNLDAEQYDSTPYPPQQLVELLAKAKAQPRPVPPTQPSKPTLRIETTTLDTGERKQMFGRTARHMTITTKYIPLAGSTQMSQESVTEAWYVDLETQLSCDFKFPPGTMAHSYGTSNPQEVPEFIDHGDAAKGFPFAQTTRITSSFKLPDGSTKQSTSQSELAVIEFEDGPLDPALFEIPSSFKFVDHVNPNPPQYVPSAWERFKARFVNLF